MHEGDVINTYFSTEDFGGSVGMQKRYVINIEEKKQIIRHVVVLGQVYGIRTYSEHCVKDNQLG